MDLLRFSHEAMATTFEILIPAGDGESAAEICEEIFTDIDTLEAELSRFRPDSDIGRINTAAAGEEVIVGMAAWDCLELARDVSLATNGAFDITIGPLYDAWRAPDGGLRKPPSELLEQARALSGMHLLDLQRDGLVVTPKAEGIRVDLGGIGKGYALDQAVDKIRDWELPSALLSAGQSTVFAVGDAPEEDGWPVNAGPEDRTEPIRLHDQALSGSGFEVKGAHIINPRTGQPCPMDKILVWASAPIAALSDALATAFIVMEQDEVNTFCATHEDVSCISMH